MKMAGYVFMTPFLSIMFAVLTSFHTEYEINLVRFLASLTFFIFGLIVIYKAMGILESCDDIINRNNK